MSHMVTPEQFVQAFGPALEEYLEQQFRKDGHILDMLATASEFFGVSHHSVHAATSLLEYTHTATEK